MWLPGEGNSRALRNLVKKKYQVDSTLVIHFCPLAKGHSKGFCFLAKGTILPFIALAYVKSWHLYSTSALIFS